ncbi:outer membrane protein assembly factor BamB [Betaproteobacteria bacterium]|nr:outer membrane protein assembly factor BamB [Betaproteobacteria bacterium]
MMSCSRLLAPGVAVLMLAGCSWLNPFSSDAGKPAKLTGFTPAAQLHERWNVSVGAADEVVFSPAVVGNSVYAAGIKGRVVRIDDGKIVWRTDLGARLSAGVGSDGDLVVVVSESGDAIALDAKSGAERWRVNVGAEVLAPPAVGSGTVVLRASDHRLFGLEARDGQRRWLYQRNAPTLALRAHAGVLIVGEVVLAGLPGGRLVAVSLENGGNVWELNIATPRGSTELERVTDVAGTPVLSRNEVCAVTYQGRAACFDGTNGNALWVRNFSSHVGLDRDNRFVVITDERDSVQALDVYSGAVVWRQDALPRRTVSRPLIVGDYVVVGDFEGYVHVLGREDGNFVARRHADSSAISADPQRLGDGFVVQTRDGDVVAYDVQR